MRDDRNLKLHCTPTAASLTVLVEGGVDDGLGSYSGVWTAIGGQFLGAIYLLSRRSTLYPDQLFRRRS